MRKLGQEELGSVVLFPVHILLRRMLNVSLDHGGHVLKLIEEEAETKRLEIKSVIESQRQNLEAKMNIVSQLDEDCAKVFQQSEVLKRDVQRFADHLIKTIHAKMQNIVTTVEGRTKTSIERNNRTLEAFVFIKNTKILDVVNGEDIGSLETLYRTKAKRNEIQQQIG